MFLFRADEPTNSAAVISGWRPILIITDMFIAVFLKETGVKINDQVSPLRN